MPPGVPAASLGSGDLTAPPRFMGKLTGVAGRLALTDSGLLLSTARSINGGDSNPLGGIRVAALGSTTQWPQRWDIFNHAVSQFQKDIVLHLGDPENFPIDNLRWVFAKIVQQADFKLRLQRGANITASQAKQRLQEAAERVRGGSLFQLQ